MEKFLTIAEVADLLRITSQTVYKMIKDGIFPAVRVGLKWRIPEEQFRQWLASQTNQSAISDEKAPLPKGTKRMVHSLKGKTILIADDEPFALSWMKEALEPLGVNILCANTGEKAAEMAQSYADTISLVILDVIMPHGNGLTAYHEMRKSNVQVPVIFASGYAESDDLIRFRKTNKVSFIQKPFKKDKIVDLLVQTLKTSSSVSANKLPT